MENKEQEWCEKTLSEVEKQVEIINKEGIQPSTIDYLGKLIDIHKDLSNEKYWKEKIQMRYRYGNYGEDSYGRRRRDSRGRYTEGGYGRRGYGAYSGEEALEEMFQGYGEYSENREQYNESGSYGAKEDTKQSLKQMLKSTEDFMGMLMEEASSQEEIQMIKKTAKKISEM